MKSYDEIVSEVKELIASKFNFPLEEIQPSSNISTLAKDSIQLFELLLSFEQYYQMEAAYEDVVQMHTVEDVTKYLAKNKYGVTQ